MREPRDGSYQPTYHLLNLAVGGGGGERKRKKKKKIKLVCRPSATKEAGEAGILPI